MDAAAVIARLRVDRPLFHSISEEGSRAVAALGFDLPAGDCSWAVGRKVLDWIAARLSADAVTVETGAGDTTVLFAAMARHHYCCTLIPTEAERISSYLDLVGLPRDRVTFSIGPSDETLPQFRLDEPASFAYIDGCHGYPMPALDWHYIDKMLRVGGILGMDNAELRPVREHCEFLEENGSYRLLEVVDDGYFTCFYEKLADEPREWIAQRYGRAKRDPCDYRVPTRLRRALTRWIKPHLY